MPMGALVCLLETEGGVKSSHSIKGGKHSQDNPDPTCCPDILCLLLVLRRLRVGQRFRGVQRHPRARAKELLELPPCLLCFLHGSPRSTAFSWAPVCVVILKTCFGMLTSASWNYFLFAPLLRGFINIELHRKQILLLSDCSVVTFLFLKSIMANFISAQSFVSY